MIRSIRWAFTGFLALASAVGAQAAEETTASGPGISLVDLASRADVVVLAQARDTDYVYRREFPVEGSAYLRVLIPYKVDKPLDIIEVYELGLHANECYFPNPTVFEEGRRYLLFLRIDRENPDRYRGLPEGCALDVLVARDSNYVLRLPATGIELSDPLADYLQNFEFADAYATENTESLSSEQRDALLDSGWIKPWGEGFIYTSGVELSTVRQLMGEAVIRAERHP